jgi:hypothetical protein
MEGKEFYFQMMTNDDQSVVFLITPKKYYDTEGCLLDVMGAVTEVLPNGFTEVQPSFFKYGGRTPDVGKEMLKTIGMSEINFGLTSVKPNKSREHEADMADEDDEEHLPPPAINHGPRVEEEVYEEPDIDEDGHDEDDPEPNDGEEDDEDEEHHDDDEFLENNPRVEGERPVIIPKIGNLNLGPGTNAANPINNNQPLPPAGGPSRPLPAATSNDLDELLSEASADKTNTSNFKDYSTMATDALLRHKKIMLDTESYMEVSRIQKELDARNIKA